MSEKREADQEAGEPQQERKILKEETLHISPPKKVKKPVKPEPPKPAAPVPARLKHRIEPSPKPKAPKKKSAPKPKVPPVAKVKVPPIADIKVPPVAKVDPAAEKEKAAKADDESPVRMGAAQSVLMRIEEKAGKVPRVMLQDIPSGPSPLVMPGADTVPSDRTLDHYDIAGEIGRGGVGVIFKARDVDLGRDVAIKLLREDMSGRVELAQRFVEEAQISGQLQHPGIAPLYELGVHPDGRPYFAMKLIKGRTLAGLLNDRHDIAKGRHRFIQIFEKICQAMAYVHSRGVIHRDIKPSNVMVGAFGEVQVMDWGFAKVLGRGGVEDERSARRLQSVISIIETVRSAGDDVGSQSLAGSLMGTPPYMPPEQASGNVNLVDARSDVFALGAVLCEILTGKPPYTPTSDESGQYEIVQQASRAQLNPARERLDKCGADEELIRICRDCLVPAQAARPADAGVLAAEIGNYLAHVEERARESQLAAVAERGKANTARAEAKAAAAKAEHERRARRLTLGLGSAVLALVLLGGGGFLFYQSKAKEREAQTHRDVSTALQEAARLHGLAKADALGEFSNWTAALTRAKQAKEDAASEDGSASLLARATATLEEIEAEEAAARQRAEQAARDAAMVARLDEIRSQKGDDFVPQRSEDQYWQAFKEYGLDIDTGALDALGDQVASSAIAKELIAALDEWAWVRAYGTVPQSKVGRPTGVAQRADKDSWRKGLRTAIRNNDVSRLKELSNSANVASLGVTSVHLLASALANSGEHERAVDLLHEAQRHHAQDLWINFYLGHWLTQLSPPRWEEAARAYTAAIAIRPEAAATWNNLGIALQSRGALDDAVVAYKRAIELRANYASAHNNLGTVYVDRKQYSEALASFRSAVQAQADHALAYFGIGSVLQKQKRVEDAIHAYKQALTYRPSLHEAHDALVALLGTAGRGGEMLAASKRVVDANPDAGWAHRNYGYVLWSQGQTDDAIKHYKRAVELDPNDGVAQHDYGVALGRTGDWDGAIKAIEAACKAEPEDALYQSNLGWALENKGDLGGAVVAFQKAVVMDPGLAVAHDQLSNVYLKTGRLEPAIDSRINAVKANPAASGYAAGLGNLLGRVMSRARAEALVAERVPNMSKASRVRFQAELAYALFNTGGDREGGHAALQIALDLAPGEAWLQELKGRFLWAEFDFEGAEAAFRNATRMDANRPSAQARLGFALQKLGRFGIALDAIRRGHELGTEQGWTEPSADWVEEAERLATAHAEIILYTTGKKQPADATMGSAVGMVCLATERWSSAAKFYEAVVQDPELDAAKKPFELYNAACAAARAGTEPTRGNDMERPDDDARKVWRGKALAWLRMSLKHWTTQVKNPEMAAVARGNLLSWLLDPDLARVRDGDHLEELDPAERKAFEALWIDVATAVK